MYVKSFSYLLASSSGSTFNGDRTSAISLFGKVASANLGIEMEAALTRDGNVLVMNALQKRSAIFRVGYHSSVVVARSAIFIIDGI